MKLTKARITNYRCIEDSTGFSIGDLTCLVGKNESGKTSLMSALHALNPSNDAKLDLLRDYPRGHYSRFKDRHPDGISETVITHWLLSEEDKKKVEDKFGSGVIKSDEISVTASIGRENRSWGIQVSFGAYIEALAQRHNLTQAEKEELSSVKTTDELIKKLSPEKASLQAGKKAVLEELEKLPNGSLWQGVASILVPRLPKFFYTSHFERMSSMIAVNSINQAKQNGTLSAQDKIFLDFISYAGTSIEELSTASRYEEARAKCEAASNTITAEIFEYWSQNTSLEIEIQVRVASSGDPSPFNSGNIIDIRIKNGLHKVSVPLSERSAGFVWFFSFLAQFRELKKQHPGAILLLDEPGLTLHGKAQADLLRFIEEKLLPEHQVIFSTHSPFMIPGDRLADVRIVEDLVQYSPRPKSLGTKVHSDVLSVSRDTLFPLQAQLGYELTQSLFVGKNTLIVEGPGDVILLKIASEALKRRGKTHLNHQWTICPAGGLEKISSFVSLFSGNKLNIAVFADFSDGKRELTKLEQRKLLESSRILTTAEFASTTHESDIEDLIHPVIYCEMINSAFEVPASQLVTPSTLVSTGKVRQLKQAEDIFRTMPAPVKEFDHYSPMEWILRNPQILDKKTQEVEETLSRFEKLFTKLNTFITN